jgi:GTP:adenosylcobinamide-phosphate guanylyltransferase
MDAIVTAGGIPQPDEPLYPFTQGGPKAMLDVAGKPMVQWVVDALDGSQKIQHIVLIGLEPESGVKSTKPLSFIPNQGSMVDNLIAGVHKLREINPNVDKLLAVSSDIPAVTSEMVDWLVDRVGEVDGDIYYCVVPREVMEARYPDSKRSFTKLKDVEVCGGDMNALAAHLADRDPEIWEKLANARKSAFKQAAMIGFDTLALFIFRRLTVDDAVRRVIRKLGVTGRAIICPYAEVGMDVDKPHQLEMVRQDLAGRASVREQVG